MAEQKEPKLIKCPCCGKLTLEAPVKIKQEDLDMYTASIITGAPYQKTYTMYKGAVRITVAALNDVIKDKMNVLPSRAMQEEDTSLQQAQQMFTIRLFTLLPVITIEVAGEKPCKKDIRAITMPLLDDALLHYKEKEWLDNAYKILIDPENVTAFSKTVIDKIVAKHLENYVLITDSGFDEDFFEGIAQD